MQPITAMRTPGRCPVRCWMRAVVCCRSKSVRPQDGQLMNSVLETRMRAACKRLKDDSRNASAPKAPASQSNPSPRPSTNRLPNSAAPRTTAPSSSPAPSTAGYRNHNITGTVFGKPVDDNTPKNFRARNVTPCWLCGCSSTKRGSTNFIALRISSARSSPLKSSAWPPRRCCGGSRNSPGSRSSVAPAGACSPGRQTTPTGTSSSRRAFSADAAVSWPSMTTASTLFQSFCTSPSARKWSPKRSQSSRSPKLANSSTSNRASTEPSEFSGTSSGNSQGRRTNRPSRRAALSRNGRAAPRPAAPSAARRKARQGPASSSGSSVRDTRTVSPRPSRSSAPMPTEDLMRPSEPPPASVTPRWRG
mmetsp:Transcript_9005/g.26903  ORF Transcript_9005/g.26903 Transcript_9005/m.26903 type:complete len:362 (-) Transcript_9005:700-1785(-)